MDSVEEVAANKNFETDAKTKVLPETGELMTIVDEAPKTTSGVQDDLKQEENFEAIVADKFEGDGAVIETEIGEKQKMSPLMKTDSIMRNEECTLDEEPQEGVDEKEANISNMSASWRDSSKNYDDDEGLSDEEDYSDDYEDEEAAEEWLTRYYLRQRGLPEVKILVIKKRQLRYPRTIS